MSRRTTPLSLDKSDGTSQRGRALAALDPTSVAIDERGHADLLAFVQAFAERLRYLEADGDALREVGTWSELARRDDLSIADIVAYMDDPGRFRGEAARWLGRPHFALLLAFLELLGHARDQLNGITRRHLDHHYREILGMRPGPPVPDRVRVVLRLAAGVAEARLPAGVALQAGRDSAGVPRIYRSEREVTITRARVDAIRVVHVERRVVGLAELRRDRGLSPDEAFDAALRLALGDPGPGDPVPTWEGQ
ncbi:MAG: hypothetical protein KC420_19665, partial [Myxococcales bacterium]|nr:hypothetical protein [Myxococcales bacterium]